MEQEWIPEARETAHVPIINQIEREDWNGAKRAVQKKLQKSKDTIYPALLTYIQAHQGSASEKGEAFIRLQTLADDKEERITDIDDLEIYEYAAKELAKGGRSDELLEFVCKIRLLAVKKIPTDEQFTTACLRKCVNDGKFDIALQISMSLAKNFPKNRHHLFFPQVMRLLLTQAPHIGAKERTMNLTLAIAHLAKYAKARIDAKGSTIPFQSLQTAQEILLYHRALKMSGKHEELITALLDPKIGVHSDIIQGDWSVVKSLVDELHVSDGPDDVKKTIDLCVGLLVKACANEDGKIVEPMYGDWAVWETYIDAIMVASDSGNQAPHLLEKFMEINDKHRFSKPAINKTNQRNARLASVKFMVMLNPRRNVDTWTFKAYEYDQLSSILHEVKLKEGDERRKLKKLTPYVVRRVPRRLLIILEYLHEYGHVTAAFTDIKPYFQMLNTEEREQLLGMAAIVMVDRRGWSCVDQGEDIGFPKSANFPPTVSVPDQITARVNHYKLSYLNSDIPDVAVAAHKDDEGNVQLDELLALDYTLCTKCKLIGVDVDGSVKKKWAQRRKVCCETCLRAVILYGMATYDHAINGWAEKAWSQFATKKTDMHPGDNAVIIVAMALIKLGGGASQPREIFPTGDRQMDESFQKRHSNRLIQAAAILEFAYTISPANPQVLLLLVRLYSVLGAGSLAMRAYSRLNLKQIQGETLGYVLLDRISVMHPHPCNDIMTADEPVPFDPAAELAKYHQRYRAFKTQISRNYMTCLQTGSYGSIFQLIDVQEKLSPSLASAMSVIELRKLLRFRNPETSFTKSSHGYDILPNGVMNEALHDNIDYKSFPSFDLSPKGAGDAFVHVFLNTGPKPTDERIRGELLIEDLMMIIRAPFSNHVNMTQLIRDLKQHLHAYEQSTPVDMELTEDEGHYLETAVHLMKMVISVGYRGKNSKDLDGQLSENDLTSLRKQLEWMVQRVVDVEEDFRGIPMAANYLQPLYIIHQSVQMVLGVEKLLQHPSFQKNQKTVQRYQLYVGEQSAEILNKLKNAADIIKDKMDGGGHIDTVIALVEEIPEGHELEHYREEVMGDDYTKATIGKGLRRVLTPEFSEVFASELVASWNESIIGLQYLL